MCRCSSRRVPPTPSSTPRCPATGCGGCAATTRPAVAYREYAGEDHLSVLPAAAADVLAWIGGRFTRQPPAKDCHAAGPS